MLVTNPHTVDFQELHLMGLRSKGKIKTIYLHWTEGEYNEVFDNYHINIGKNGEVFVTCTELYQQKSHTFRRNAESISIALCCCKGAYYTSRNPQGIKLGKVPPTQLQVEKMAQVVAILTDALDLPIEFSTVKTHAEVAIMDGYGPFSDENPIRWDLWFLPHPRRKDDIRLGGIVLREKANWYKRMFFEREAA